MADGDASYWGRADEEVRLLDLLAVVWRHRWWVLGSGAVAGVVAFALSLLSPDWYSAQTTLLIAPPPVTGQLDARLQIDTVAPRHVDIQGLAMTERMMRRVRDHGIEEGWLSPGLTTGSFASQCTVHSLPDSQRMMALEVSSRRPETSVGLTEFWAQELVSRSREIFTIHTDDLEQYENRASEAAETLAQAQAAYEQVLPETRVRAREAALDAEQQNLRNRLQKIDRLEALAADARSLRGRLAEITPASRRLQLGELMGFVALESVNEGRLAGLELQVGGGNSFTAPNVESARQSLQRLVNAIAAQQQQLKQEVEALQSRVTELATELETARHERQLVKRERDEVQQVHEMVQLQKRQARLMMEDQADTVSVVVEPVIRELPDWPPRLALAVVAGGLVSLLVAGVLVFNQRPGDATMEKESA